jgi:hypothetical protein
MRDMASLIAERAAAIAERDAAIAKRDSALDLLQAICAALSTGLEKWPELRSRRSTPSVKG